MPSVGGKTTCGPPSPIRGSSRTERGSSRASSGGSSRSGNGRGEGVQFNSNQSSGRGPSQSGRGPNQSSRSVRPSSAMRTGRDNSHRLEPLGNTTGRIGTVRPGSGWSNSTNRDRPKLGASKVHHSGVSNRSISKEHDLAAKFATESLQHKIENDYSGRKIKQMLRVKKEQEAVNATITQDDKGVHVSAESWLALSACMIGH